MSEYGLIGNYSASPSLGNYGGLSQGASASPKTSSGGGMNFGSLIQMVLGLLQSREEQMNQQGKSDAPAVIGGGQSPVSTSSELFNYNPSTMHSALQNRLKQSRGF
jgi:hypothetical protein